MLQDETLINLLTQIALSSKQRIDDFELKLVNLLHEELDLIACTFYSSTGLTDALVLRGQAGFRYRDYSSFVLDRETPVGRAMSNGKVASFGDVREILTFRDQALIEGYNLGPMVVLPLERLSGDDSSPVSAICFYPSPDVDLVQFTANVSSLKDIIEHSLDVAIEHTFHDLRRAIVNETLLVTDSASFFHKALQHLLAWNFEGGSVFLYDTRSKCLRLSATTGLVETDLPKRNVFYRENAAESTTVEAFRERVPKLISHEKVAEKHPRFREKTKSEFRSAIVVPFFAPKFKRQVKDAQDECLGVLRLTNRVIRHNSKMEVADFSWEDHEIIEFFLDLAGVIIHMFKRVSAKTDEFERVVHGLETNVLTVLGAIKNIEEFVDYRNVFPQQLRHSLPNAVAFSESIHEQIRVFKMRGIEIVTEVESTWSNLYGDVISKLRPFAATIAHFYDLSALSLDLEAFQKKIPDQSASDPFLEIPRVYVDVDLLLSVFKNLIENSIKYSSTTGTCAIVLKWKVTTNFVAVYVFDNGIGIPEEDEPFIFNETYQAENAMRRRTAGAGIGLFQCRAIMEKLGGEVTFDRQLGKRAGFSSAFVVNIPRG